MASADSLIIIEAAHVTGTEAVIKSPHFDRDTPLVSLRGFNLGLHHRNAHKKVMKKKTITKIKRNHNQYQ